MKKVSFILGLIAGILGIIIGAILLIKGLLMPAIEPVSNIVIVVAILGTLFGIAGLVAACIGKKRKVISGVIMILVCIAFIPVGLFSISADSILTFIGGLIVAILFLISGIFTFCIKIK